MTEQKYTLRVASGESILPALKSVKEPYFGIIETQGINELPTGDIALYNQSEELILLVERKTKADLIASLNDDRYSKQLSRLHEIHANHPNALIGFVIEHSVVPNHSDKETDQLTHTMTSIIFKYGYFCIQTPNLQSTAMVINDAARKIGWKIDDKLNPLRASGGSVKMKKKSEYLHEHFFAHQLALVNRVSLRTAQAIVSKYKTLTNLWKAWQASETPETLLQEIQISPKTAQEGKVPARVGLALSKNIYYHITGTPIPETNKAASSKRRKVT